MRFIKKEEEGLNYEFIIQYKQDGISFENKYMRNDIGKAIDEA